MSYSTTQSTQQAQIRDKSLTLRAARNEPPVKENPDRDRLDKEGRLDKDLEETFPASDAPATGGVTKIGSDGEEAGKPRHHDAQGATGSRG